MDEGGYGRFDAFSRVELGRFFHLDGEGRRLVAAPGYSRLGFAVQVVTAHLRGMSLLHPLDVPSELVDYLAEQLNIEDPSCVKRYTDRRMTRPVSNSATFVSAPKSVTNRSRAAA